MFHSRRHQPAHLRVQAISSDTAAVTGTVNTQAMSMLRATPQRTAETCFDAPTPMMLEEITCVVLTGAFIQLAVRLTAAAAVSAGRSRRAAAAG